MNASDTTHRRSFLRRVVGTAAAASVSNRRRAHGGRAARLDDWIKDVKGTHRCFFDFPQHKNGLPLLHILNYLNTYSAAYKVGPGQAGAVGTFYGMGTQSSIPFAFNDAIWRSISSVNTRGSRMRRGSRTLGTSSTGRRRTTCTC